MTRVMLTGASGFVGSALTAALISRPDICVVKALRKGEIGPDCVVVGNIDGDTDFTKALVAVDVVIHAAARAHIMHDEVDDPLSEYRHVNVKGTLNLARQAIASGVKRFLFLSSIKANGEATAQGKKFGAGDLPGPEDAYGVSKVEAEQGLLKLSAESGLEVVIIRPPLVYGAGVKGNFANIIKLVHKGVPLPLGTVYNKRSLVGIDNLVDLIIRCIDHPAAANQVFLAGDGEDLSTTELLRGVGEAMGKPARLFPMSAGILQFGATVLGKKTIAQRLLGSLQVDISKTCEMLDWKPPYTVQEGLRRCFERSN